MTTTFHQQDGRAVLQLLGDIDIAGSIELKTMLTQAFSTGKDVGLDFSAAETLDITAIQLLWAAARQAEKTGTPLTVVGPLPQGILSVMRSAGFEHFPVAMETVLLQKQTTAAGAPAGPAE